MTILELSNNSFLTQLASKNSTPGGGAVAAINGAQAAALIGMVLELTRDMPPELEKDNLLADLVAARETFGQLAQDDVDGFKSLMNAYKANDVTDLCLQTAAKAPIDCLQQAINIIPVLETTHKIGNANLITDTAIAALLLKETILASELNVLINLRSMKDESFNASAREKIAEARAFLPRLEDIATEIRDSLT